MFSIITAVILIFFCLIPFNLSASSLQEKPVVKILTWWGYFDDPRILNQVEKDCNVTVSIDEFYSNGEFLRRWHDQGRYYDVVIFSNNVYNNIKLDIFRSKSDLWKASFDYHPQIRKHYLLMHFPSNVAYFMHSLTGFLWNPERITLSDDDDISDIFFKNKTNIAMIIDDPIEASNLIFMGVGGNNKASKLKPLTVDDFRRVTKNGKVYITNDYSQLYKNKNFSFAFTWSGSAIDNLKKSGKNYHFLVHPKLSYITSDLIAELNEKKYVHCVSRILSGKKIMSIFQNTSWYFSPYLDMTNSQDAVYLKTYHAFLNILPAALWSDGVSSRQFDRLVSAWEMIRVEANNRQHAVYDEKPPII